jgi:hypothetical protein
MTMGVDERHARVPSVDVPDPKENVFHVRLSAARDTRDYSIFRPIRPIRSLHRI